MSEKIEGTMILDGLVEGRLGDIPGTDSKLRDWRGFVEKAGLRFNLEIEGGSFNLLAENKPVEVRKLGDRPSQVILDALSELLKIFPLEARRGVFSTVRSVEYRKGEEVQTLYTVGPDGSMKSRERVVEAQTVAPAPPSTRGEKLRMGAVGVAVAALVLLASTLFIDYRAMWNRAVASLWPVSAKAVEVEAPRFEKYFVVEDKKSASAGRSLVVTLKRTDAFPKTDAEAEQAAREAGGSVQARLAAEAVIRGRLFVEYYDKDNKLIVFAQIPIQELRRKETFNVELPLPSDRVATRIVLTD